MARMSCVCSLVLLFVVLILITCVGESWAVRQLVNSQVGAERKVLVVSLDGFSRQYLTRHKLESLAHIFAHGSYPSKFRNQFPTKTFPNHFTVATGLYTEVHGVVGNTVYDRDTGSTYRINDAQLFQQHPHIMPAWTLNELAGGHSGCIMWPGCKYSYHDRNVTFFSDYHEEPQLRDSINLAVEWMADAQTPANLVFLYHTEPDNLGHMYGPDSPYVSQELKKIDDDIGYLYHMLSVHQLQGLVDVIILSDHGMAAVTIDHIINLDNIVDPSLYHTSGFSPVLNIWVNNDEKEIDVLENLYVRSKEFHYEVYRKDKPEMVSWHYHDNSRISSITLVANPGYVFQDFLLVTEAAKKKGYPNLTETYGEHGYPVDMPEMEPFFVATGPSFKRGYQLAGELSNVDVFPLICHLLALTPPPNNGSLDKVFPILSAPVSVEIIRPLVIALVGLVLLIGLIGGVACTLARQDKRTVSADALINGYVFRKTMKTNQGQQPQDDSEEECLLSPIEDTRSDV